MKVSIIVPVYNEIDNIHPLLKELALLKESISDFEVIVVDDGSSDGTWQELEQCRETFGFLNPIQHKQNRGQSAAILTGMCNAEGQVIVTMDGDLQNDPADIPALVQTLQEGQADCICGYRAKRKDSWSRRTGSRLANRVRNWITHDGVRDTGCSLKAFRKECIADLPSLKGVHRFMPAYFRLHGRQIVEMPVHHRSRRAGQSKYTNLKRLPRTILDLLGFCWYRSRLIR